MLKRFVLCFSLALMACPSPNGPMCGASNEQCCETAPACEQGLSCQAGKCQTASACGAEGQACCVDNVCNQGLFCATETHKCTI